MAGPLRRQLPGGVRSVSAPLVTFVRGSGSVGAKTKNRASASLRGRWRWHVAAPGLGQQRPGGPGGPGAAEPTRPGCGGTRSGHTPDPRPRPGQRALLAPQHPARRAPGSPRGTRPALKHTAPSSRRPRLGRARTRSCSTNHVPCTPSSCSSRGGRRDAGAPSPAKADRVPRGTLGEG